MRRIIPVAILVLTFIGIVIVVIPLIQYERAKDIQTRTLKNLKEIAFSLKLYAADHDGFLPASLDELVPTYATAESVRSKPAFLTQSVNLDKLPSKTVILRAADHSSRAAEVRAVEVRADMSFSINNP